LIIKKLTNKNLYMEAAMKQVVHLTTQEFKEKVFNYDLNNDWKYAGELPAIIDFYADWCGPCKMVAPVLEEIASDYSGKIHVFKVNTENERELASVFGIQSIPTILFVPKEGTPQAAMGAMPRESFDRVIKEVLLMN
jgi:thioredoxin 1